MLSRNRIVASVIVLLVTACGEDVSTVGESSETSGCPVGAETCACTAGGACDPGLTCYSGLCVATDDTSIDPSNPTSTPDPDSSSSSETSDETSSSSDTSTSECGDGIVEGDEVCDGTALRGETCASHGFELGELACSPDCATLDLQNCWNPSCGDQLTEGSEICDGIDLGGATCISEGFDSGALACSLDCAELDTSGCGTCGNALIDGDETCDGNAVGGATCTMVGYDSGTLACASGCDALDPTGCGTCGNQTIDGSESCDGNELGGETCSSQGFDSGTLACAESCADFDTLECGTCGNDLVDGGEVCDGVDLGGATCQSEGFDLGTLACTNDCSGLDTSACAECGNGILEPGEECDGGIGMATCESLGFIGGGTPGCTPTCELSTYTCCGDDGGGLTVQQRIDLAVDDDVIYVGDTVENVTVAGKRITLRGNCTGVAATWSCADTNARAIAIGAGADVVVEGFVFEACNGSTLAVGGSGVISGLSADRVVLRRNIFRNNAGYRGSVFTTHGGAMPVDGQVIIEHNIMHDNTADDGGVIYVFGDTNVTIHNNLVYDNSAVDYCGAIWLRDQQQAKMVFTKNVVWGNFADRNPAVEVFSGEGAVVDSSIIAGNSPSNVAAAFVNSFSLFGGNPLFVDPNAGDFALQLGSPAIDTGNPALPDDLDGTQTDRGVYLDQLPVEP